MQNYKRLGLASRLNAPTGGTEKKATSTSTASAFSITTALPTAVKPTVARVERDESGKIIKVIHQHKQRANPLNDPLNDLEDDSENEEFAGFEDDEKMGGVGNDETANEIVRQLEEQASRIAEKKPRSQSVREKEWCAALVEKHGQNWMGMVRDRKLNPMQQTEADIKKRVSKYLSEKN